MKRKKKPLMLTAFIILLLLSLTTVASATDKQVDTPAANKTEEQKQIFSDVKATDNNAVYINYLSNRKILNGYPDGTFHPEDGLTRAQAAVVVVKAARLTTSAVAQTGFPDVNADHWAAASIAAAAQAGYIKGFPDGTFKPEETLTRSQGISTILRLSTQKDRALLPVLNDMDASHWAARDLATALAAGMIGLSADNTQIYPDAIMKRGSLARSLGTLLTIDPGLYTVSLAGTIKDVKGDIQLTRNGTTTPLKNNSTVYAGDIIKTGIKASATISYPDGSSVLIVENSELSIKKSIGRTYIKNDGTSGIAVENVNIEMKKGTVFGALATRQATHEKQTARTGFPLLAALDSRQFIADQDQMPWFQTAETKKVRMTVDMPWGVAAIRGTFISVTVNADGTCNVSCLTGSAEISDTSGNTVSLGGGTSSGITEGGTPASPVPMNAQAVQSFGNVQGWIVNTALQMEVNKEAAPPPVIEMILEIPGQPIPGQQPAAQVQNMLDVVINAMQASGIEISAQTIQDLQQQLQDMQVNISQAAQDAINNQDNDNNQQPGSDSGGGDGGDDDTTISVTSITATNGTIIVTLSGVPTDPVAADFTFTKKIGTADAVALTVGGFAWNETTKVASFTFTAVAPSTANQSVVIAGSYKAATDVSATAFTIAADRTAPTMTKLTAYGHYATIESTSGTLTVVQNSVTTSIIVDMSEAVSLVVDTPTVMITLSGVNHEYGTIAIGSDNQSLIITPTGTNGTAGLVGNFTFTVAAGQIKDTAGNMNAETTFSLTVTEVAAPDPLATWTSITSLPGDLYGLTVGNNQVMAVGNGKAYKSDDGISWTVMNAMYGDNLSAVAYGAGKYVAVGTNKIRTLVDGGTNWTSVSVSGSLSSIAFDSDHGFVALSGNTAYISADAINNWTSHSIGISNHGYLSSLAYGNGVFVAVGWDSPSDWTQQYPVAYTSTDGVNWSAHNITSANQGKGWAGYWCEPGPGFTDITFVNGKFIAPENITWSGDPLPRYIYASTDGVNWSPCFSTTESKVEYLYSCTGNGSTIIVNSSNGLYKSTDNGSNWSTLPALSKNITDMIYFNGGFIGVGAQGGLRCGPGGGGTGTNTTSLDSGGHYYDYASHLLSLHPDPETFVSDTTININKITISDGSNNYGLMGYYNQRNSMSSVVVHGDYYFDPIDKILSIILTEEDTDGLLGTITKLYLGDAGGADPTGITVSVASGWNYHEALGAAPASGPQPLEITGWAPDTTPPTGINIDRQNNIPHDDRVTLTAVDGPLSSTSWADILAEIKSHTAVSDGTWIRGINANDLTIEVGLNGKTADLINNGDNDAIIVDDFVIPAIKVIDLVGNTAVSNIVIDSRYVADIQEERLFFNWNIYGVASNPSNPTTFTINQSYAITYIDTCHHNGGSGATPGTISLQHSDGTIYGPWNTLGHSGNGVWVVNNKTAGQYEPYDSNLEYVAPGSQYPIIKAGSYTVVDSSPGTWGYNSSSGNAGIAQIKGYPLTFADARLDHLSFYVYNGDSPTEYLFEFSSDTYSYTINVGNNTDYVEFDYETIGNADVDIYLEDLNHPYEQWHVNLEPGANTIIFVVISEDDLHTQTYTVTINRDAGTGVTFTTTVATSGVAGTKETNYIYINQGAQTGPNYLTITVNDGVINGGADQSINSYINQSICDGAYVAMRLETDLEANTNISADYNVYANTMGDGYLVLEAKDARADRNVAMHITNLSGDFGVVVLNNYATEYQAGNAGTQQLDELTFTTGATTSGGILAFEFNAGTINVTKIVSVTQGESAASIATKVCNAFSGYVTGYTVSNPTDGLVRFIQNECNGEVDFEVTMTELSLGGAGAPEITVLDSNSNPPAGYFGSRDMAFRILSGQECTISYVIVDEGDGAPTAEQVLSGCDADNIPALRFGIIAVKNWQSADSCYDAVVGIHGDVSPALGVCAPYDVYIVKIGENGSFYNPVKLVGYTRGC
jgi:hypothetical protein